MNPNDLVILNGATELAQRGEKVLAYALLKPLLKTNPNDVNLLLWIAFTAPDLSESEFAIIKAGMVDAIHPGLASARNWLASAFAAQKAQLGQSAAPTLTAPVEEEMDDEPTTQLRMIVAEQPIVSPGFSPRQQAATALIEPPQMIQQLAALPVTLLEKPAVSAPLLPLVSPDSVAIVHETAPAQAAINWEECYPHLYEQVPIPAWAKPITMPEPLPVVEPEPEPEIALNSLADHSRQPSRWAKAVKGFFAK